MIISDATILKLLDTQELRIDPLIEANIQPASIDCTLGNHFLEVNTRNTEVLSLDEEINYNEIVSDTIVIPPHSFLLATTQEYIALPAQISTFVEGRSYNQFSVFSTMIWPSHLWKETFKNIMARKSNF